MGQTSTYLSAAQLDLLRWVADGCKDDVYEGFSHRVSARALHNRGFLRVTGSGNTWNALITPDGTERLQEEGKRVEAEQGRVLEEERARLEREREQRQRVEEAVDLLHDVVAAGGRLDLGPDADPHAVEKTMGHLTGLELPEGQRLAQEPTRMDPTLGVTVYLEPDFESLTPLRVLDVPRQLRDPHPAVVAFQGRRTFVSKAHIGRATRLLQAFVSAATHVGWNLTRKTSPMFRGQMNVSPDLTLQLPSRQVAVTIHELDSRGRRGQVYTAEQDYFTRTVRTTLDPRFQASGDLEVTITAGWEDKALFAIRDTDGTPVEDQLPGLIRQLEIAEAEAGWFRQEESRRLQIRTARWEEVKQDAFVKLSHERNADRLRDELDRRSAAEAMRSYADEVEERGDRLQHEQREQARAWAAWIREHAERTDPINGPLQVLTVTSATQEDLQRHMAGWSTYGPHRQ